MKIDLIGVSIGFVQIEKGIFPKASCTSELIKFRCLQRKARPWEYVENGKRQELDIILVGVSIGFAQIEKGSFPKVS